MTFSTPRKWEIWALVGLALSLGWVLGLGFARGFWSEQTAAWVQAVGSVAGILLAIHIGKQERDEQRVRDRTAWVQAKIDRAYAVLIIARHAHAKGQCAGIGLDVEESGFVPAHFQALVTSLAEIPLHSLGDEELVGATIDLRSAMELLVWNFEAGEDEIADPEDQSEPGRRQEAVDGSVWAIQEARDKIAQVVIRLIALRDEPGRSRGGS